jgi:hypothetical protein
MFARIVREYPLSDRSEDAKRRLQDLELPVPQVDQAAYDREKFEAEHYKHPGMVARSTSWIHGGPDVSHAAKEGQPTMTDPKRTIPASVPVVNTEVASNGGTGTGTTDVSATTVGANDTALEKNTDARAAGAAAAGAKAATTANQPLPTNRDAELQKYREKQAKKQAKAEKKKKKKEQQASEHPDQKQSLVSPGASNSQPPPQQQ